MLFPFGVKLFITSCLYLWWFLKLKIKGVYFETDIILLKLWRICLDLMYLLIKPNSQEPMYDSLSGVPDFSDRNKILNGYDLSHDQVPHCIRVFFYFVWFVFIHHNFQFYFKLCTYCNILDIYLS